MKTVIAYKSISNKLFTSSTKCHKEDIEYKFHKMLSNWFSKYIERDDWKDGRFGFYGSHGIFYRYFIDGKFTCYNNVKIISLEELLIFCCGYSLKKEPKLLEWFKNGEDEMRRIFNSKISHLYFKIQ